MKVSYDWLQTFFAKALPPPETLEELITFHSSEVEELVPVGDDTVLDIKVLPDKSAWLMSVRGVAKEVSTIIGERLSRDPFTTHAEPSPKTEGLLTVATTTAHCDYYSAALITGVAVGPSPDWLKNRLSAIGQRPINTIVDATNYVMFELGQPLHAFDAARLSQKDGRHAIVVRQAKSAEKIVTLSGEVCELMPEDAVIVDGTSDLPIGIAGVKGGQAALVDETTNDIIIESAHFDRYAVRNTAKRLRLQTDAAKRYENGISVCVAPYGLSAVVELILDIAGGKLVGVETVGNPVVTRQPVTSTVAKIQSVLGVQISSEEVSAVLDRFGYQYTQTGDAFSVVPPPWRDDLNVTEDLIEEIGRMYGLRHIVSIPPLPQPYPAINLRHYYAEKIRQELTALGWSEIYTSSFRAKDVVPLKNALASDKSFLRSGLGENMQEALIKNVPQRDLLGLSAIKLFEIGTVFSLESESFHVCLGVRTGTEYKAKLDDKVLDEAKAALQAVLGGSVAWLPSKPGVAEFSLDTVLPDLAVPQHYDPLSQTPVTIYRSFSVYPAITRDVALWVDNTVMADIVQTILDAAAGELRVRTTLFDEFTKDDRVSFAFRLVFQAKDRTLTDEEVELVMVAVYAALDKAGFTVR